MFTQERVHKLFFCYIYFCATMLHVIILKRSDQNTSVFENNFQAVGFVIQYVSIILLAIA